MNIVDRRFSVAEGTAFKAPCRAATTANITLSGAQTIDGVSIIEGDRVLVKNQTSSVDNGIYRASTGNWTRERDFDGAYDVVTGTAVYITAGTVSARHTYLVSTTGEILPGTTSISFVVDAASGLADAAAAAVAASAASASAAATSASSASASATAAAASATAAAASAASARASIVDYGITGNAHHYTNAEFQTAFAAAAADGHREIFVPRGNYLLAEQIQIHSGFVLVGESASSSVFQFYHATNGFFIDGTAEVGGGLKNLSIVNDSGGAATSYVYLYSALVGTSPDFFTIEGCNFTGFSGATVSYGVVCDGNDRDGSAPNALIGLRGLKFKDTDIFNATTANLDLRNVRSAVLSNIAHYQASGSVTKIIIGGTGTGRLTSNVRLVGCTLGDVSIDKATKIIASGCDLNGVTITANASSCRIATAFGAVSNSGSGCTVST